MEFISSISFPNEPLISWPFLSSLLVGFAIALPLHPSKSDAKMAKKCTTDKNESSCDISGQLVIFLLFEPSRRRAMKKNHWRISNGSIETSMDKLIRIFYCILQKMFSSYSPSLDCLIKLSMIKKNMKFNHLLSGE